MHEPARRPSVSGGTSTAEKLCFDKNEFMKVCGKIKWLAKMFALAYFL